MARQAAQRVRNKLSLAWIEEAGHGIQQAVLALPEFREARTVGLYLARPREVGTDLLIQDCRAKRRTVCLPAYQKERERYAMARWEAGAALRPGLFGIAEPAEPAWMPVSEIDLMIVTCLAFDDAGWRLGHGGGYFDRLLSEYPGVRMCLAFECQHLAAVPCEAHDVPVHLVVTEQRVYRAPARLAYADPDAWKHR